MGDPSIPTIRRLAVVCPMANEADNAERFVTDVLAQCRGRCREAAFFAILDRVSRDDTRAILERMQPVTPELRVVYAPENRSVVDAYFRGYREALHHGADWILEIDAGYSHRPVDIPALLEAVRGVDCVFATRFAKGGHYDGGLTRRKIVSWTGSRLARLLLGGPLTDMTSGFQLFSRRALDRVAARGVRSRGPFFQAEIKHYLRGLPAREVPIRYVPTAQVVRRAALWDAVVVLLILFARRLLQRS